MFPRLLSFENFSLPTYGVLLAAALLTGWTLAVRLAKREGVNPDHAWNLAFYAIISAILGAKALFVAQSWSYYAEHPREIFSLGVLQSGGVFYGGLVTALLVSLAYVRIRRMPMRRTGDAFVPGIALGHAIGRLGCFAGGCCYGRPTDLPWGVTFTDPMAAFWAGTPLGVALHPTQLYEAAVELGIFAVLMLMLRRKRFDGQVFGSYLFLYGFARYFLEFLRGDVTRSLGGVMTTTQLISILLVVAGGLLWLRRPVEGTKAPARDAAR